MIALAAVVALALISAGLAVLVVLLDRARAVERRDLLDRIQAPQVAQVAAAQRLVPPMPEPEPEPDVFVPVTDEDLVLDRLLDPI